MAIITHPCINFNTLRPRQNGRHFADDIFKCIFLNENVWILIKISLKFVPQGPVNNILALVQIMAWRRSGDKPLSELMLVSLPTHICVTRPQWVNSSLDEVPLKACVSNYILHVIDLQVINYPCLKHNADLAWLFVKTAPGMTSQENEMAKSMILCHWEYD